MKRTLVVSLDVRLVTVDIVDYCRHRPGITGGHVTGPSDGRRCSVSRENIEIYRPPDLAGICRLCSSTTAVMSLSFLKCSSTATVQMPLFFVKTSKLSLFVFPLVWRMTKWQ